MEHELIDWLKQRFPARSPCSLGIGDDAAILTGLEGPLVVTTDGICDGVHFDLRRDSPEQIGHKALAVNLSDLAAMGATPRAAVITLSLPRTMNLSLVKAIYAGINPLADAFDVVLCGGDTCVCDGPLSISMTALGTLSGAAWQIDRAKPGQQILVTGPLGGSLAGKHLTFEPRCRFADRWSGTGLVAAATDISDSLSQDLAKMARASHVGFELVVEDIPISDAALELSNGGSGRTPLDHALYDGEDFELLLAVDGAGAEQLIQQPVEGIELKAIGQFTAIEEFFLIDEQGKRPLIPRGYEHRFA